MQTILIREKSRKDGTLALRIPLGTLEPEYEVLVVVQPHLTETTPDVCWPADYFD